MAPILSLLTTLVSLVFALRVGQQYLARKRPHQLVWSLALFFYALGAGCQLLAEWLGWNAIIYRLWYLTGAILTAAYLGQGTVYLQSRRKELSHTLMVILLIGSILAVWMVIRAPVNLNAALEGASVSGEGFPRSVRLLTPFFNIFGTLTLVGGALKSTWYFLWNGKSSFRALGTGLIALGAIVVAAGGTLARFSFPGALYLAELFGVIGIFVGYTLTDQPVSETKLETSTLTHRRRRITGIGVGVGAVTIFGLIAILPVLPWTMGIVTQVKHVYTSDLPEENRGVYLITDNGVMQLYTWQIEPSDFPLDAPVLDKDSVYAVVVIQKQFDPPEDYLLYNVAMDKKIVWQGYSEKDNQLRFTLGGLDSGDYMLQVPADSMYGGKTYHYFHLN